MRFSQIIIFYLLVVVTSITYANPEPTLLAPEVAFQVKTKILDSENISLQFEIAEGYYLYQHRFAFESQTKSITTIPPIFPTGIAKKDAAFGDVIVYRNQLSIPLQLNNPELISTLSLKIKFQGCADIGVCYPPQEQILVLKLPIINQPATINNPLTQLLRQNNSSNNSANELLTEEQAFKFSAQVKDPHTLAVNWEIADGYYLYREKISFQLLNADQLQLGTYEIPHGKPKQDAAFGAVEIFYQQLKFDIPLNRQNIAAQEITLKANFQGCAKIGVCYPPMQTTVYINLPETPNSNLQPNLTTSTTTVISEQNQIANALSSDSIILTLLSFLGFGLLLSFTPCVFPMIPILSGIIIGQGKQVSTKKAFLLSLSYVIASALTYTVFGVLAALFGSNLQTAFQQPWVIGLFSGIFVLLSLSMFGFYNLELPKSLQAQLHNSGDKHRDGSYLGAGIMGSLSSLIVGPCVAAPLAGALIYIGQTGDAILGGSALFMLGLGMGIPLLIVGASAGKLLPKAGQWLNSTKAVFGVLMLAVSIWMLERILATTLILCMWAFLLIISAIYLRATEPLPESCSGWSKLWKGLGIIMLVYGILMLIGVSAGNTNILQPLQGLSANSSTKQHAGLKFERINSITELETRIQQASNNGQTVMLDFYADWCISCKEMETYTFTDPQVQQVLANTVLLQADVTANNANDQALLKHFNLIGPPAILFFDRDQQEQTQARVIGYQASETFLEHLNSLKLL